MWGCHGDRHGFINLTPPRRFLLVAVLSQRGGEDEHLTMMKCGSASAWELSSTRLVLGVIGGAGHPVPHHRPAVVPTCGLSRDADGAADLLVHLLDLAAGQDLAPSTPDALARASGIAVASYPLLDLQRPPDRPWTPSTSGPGTLVACVGVLTSAPEGRSVAPSVETRAWSRRHGVRGDEHVEPAGARARG